MSIRLTVVSDEDRVSIVATDEIEQRRLGTVADIRRFLADRGQTLTESQYRGLGAVTAILFWDEEVPKYGPDHLDKVLDSVFFPSSSPTNGRVFSRALGEGLFSLERRGDDIEGVARDLLEHAQRDFNA